MSRAHPRGAPHFVPVDPVVPPRARPAPSLLPPLRIPLVLRDSSRRLRSAASPPRVSPGLLQASPSLLAPHASGPRGCQAVPRASEVAGEPPRSQPRRTPRRARPARWMYTDLRHPAPLSLCTERLGAAVAVRRLVLPVRTTDLVPRTRLALFRTVPSLLRFLCSSLTKGTKS